MLIKILRFITHLTKKKRKEKKEIVMKKMNKRLKNLDFYINL